MLAAPKRQVQHQATAGRAVLRNARRDSYGFTKGSERIWRAQELLIAGRDRIDQTATELGGRHRDLVSRLVGPWPASVTQLARSEIVKMNIARLAVQWILEMVVFAVGQAMAHELLSTLEFPTFVNRLVIPLHAAGERDLLEIRVEYKFRANRAAARGRSCRHLKLTAGAFILHRPVVGSFVAVFQQILGLRGWLRP